jgi:hypothetical protein
MQHAQKALYIGKIVLPETCLLLARIKVRSVCRGREKRRTRTGLLLIAHYTSLLIFAANTFIFLYPFLYFCQCEISLGSIENILYCHKNI